MANEEGNSSVTERYLLEHIAHILHLVGWFILLSCSCGGNSDNGGAISQVSRKMVILYSISFYVSVPFYPFEPTTLIYFFVGVALYSWLLFSFLSPNGTYKRIYNPVADSNYPNITLFGIIPAMIIWSLIWFLSKNGNGLDYCRSNYIEYKEKGRYCFQIGLYIFSEILRAIAFLPQVVIICNIFRRQVALKQRQGTSTVPTTSEASTTRWSRLHPSISFFMLMMFMVDVLFLINVLLRNFQGLLILDYVQVYLIVRIVTELIVASPWILKWCRLLPPVTGGEQGATASDSIENGDQAVTTDTSAANAIEMPSAANWADGIDSANANESNKSGANAAGRHVDDTANRSSSNWLKGFQSFFRRDKASTNDENQGGEDFTLPEVSPSPTSTSSSKVGQGQQASDTIAVADSTAVAFDNSWLKG